MQFACPYCNATLELPAYLNTQITSYPCPGCGYFYVLSITAIKPYTYPPYDQKNVPLLEKAVEHCLHIDDTGLIQQPQTKSEAQTKYEVWYKSQQNKGFFKGIWNLITKDQCEKCGQQAVSTTCIDYETIRQEFRRQYEYDPRDQRSYMVNVPYNIVRMTYLSKCSVCDHSSEYTEVKSNKAT